MSGYIFIFSAYFLSEIMKLENERWFLEIEIREWNGDDFCHESSEIEDVKVYESRFEGIVKTEMKVWQFFVENKNWIHFWRENWMKKKFWNNF